MLLSALHIDFESVDLQLARLAFLTGLQQLLGRLLETRLQSVLRLRELGVFALQGDALGLNLFERFLGRSGPQAGPGGGP